MITLFNIKSKARAFEVYSDAPLFDEHRVRVLQCDVQFLLSTNEVLTIKKGFEWDEASVPCGLQWAFPKSGKYAFAALVHDALYYKTFRSRAYADREFLSWMKVTINNQQAWLRWGFVRAFGWLYWRKNIKRPSKRLLYNLDKISINE